jgi:hypothetical protein
MAIGLKSRKISCRVQCSWLAICNCGDRKETGAGRVSPSGSFGQIL